MTRVVNLLDRGGQRYAEQVLEWNRGAIRKGQQEIQTGQSIKDRFHERGRQRSEDQLPHLLDDIRAIVEPLSQPIRPSAVPVSTRPSPRKRSVRG